MKIIIPLLLKNLNNTLGYTIYPSINLLDGQFFPFVPPFLRTLLFLRRYVVVLRNMAAHPWPCLLDRICVGRICRPKHFDNIRHFKTVVIKVTDMGRGVVLEDDDVTALLFKAVDKRDKKRL